MDKCSDAGPALCVTFSNVAGRLSAAVFAASVRWRVHHHVAFYASLLCAEAPDGIRAAGVQDTNFAPVQMTAGFGGA